MEILRTPDEQFTDLRDFPFSPHYVDVPSGDGETLRIHYVDEGNRDAPSVLLMHGEPSWSYLYRHMIPPIVDAGYRAVAPDLVGFGRSDKPASREDHTYARHVMWMQAWIETLEMQDVTLVGQDWGGLIGLRMVAAAPARFARVVVANTGLPTGDQEMPRAFKIWQRFAMNTPILPVGQILQQGTVTRLDGAVLDAYKAPFPNRSYRAGARALPALVPTSPDDPAADDNRAAWEVLRTFEKPFLTAFSDSDPITARGDLIFKRFVPGAKGQPHVTIENAGHFLQEDNPHQFARVVCDFIAQTE